MAELSRYALHLQAIISTSHGMRETTPSDPEAMITIRVVEEGPEVQVRNDGGDVETQIQVTPISSATINSGDPRIRRGGKQEPMLISSSQLYSVPLTGQQGYVDMTLGGLQAKVDIASSQPQIISIRPTPHPH